jgi:hypothetical protein
LKTRGCQPGRSTRGDLGHPKIVTRESDGAPRETQPRRRTPAQLGEKSSAAPLSHATDGPSRGRVAHTLKLKKDVFLILIYFFLLT